MKIAFLFPGQGAQSVGMCKDIYDNFEESREVYNKASKILNKDIERLCFNSTQEELNNTANTQIAILVTSLAICNVLRKNNINPDVCAGLSLGEYTALIQSGYLDFEDGIELVEKRGAIMEQCNSDKYMMSAIVGMESSIIEEVCRKTDGFVVAANYNYSGQTVISGYKDSVEIAQEELRKLGAKKVIPLQTSGPFHTEKLKDASMEFKKELDNTQFKNGNITVLRNIDGEEYNSNDNFSDILSKHMISPVRMDKIITNLNERGIELYVEVGPGRALGGFVRKELKDANVISVNSIENLNKLLEYVKE